MLTDPAFAEWLQSDGRVVVVNDAAILAKWDDLAQIIDVQTPLHAEVDAASEAARRMAFGNRVLVEETISLPRVIDVAAYRGSCHNIIIANNPDYAAGAIVFVLGGYVDHATGITNLTVLRAL
jgi:hypothetical protein